MPLWVHCRSLSVHSPMFASTASTQARHVAAALDVRLVDKCWVGQPVAGDQ